jgi:hypothetical protein
VTRSTCSADTLTYSYTASHTFVCLFWVHALHAFHLSIELIADKVSGRCVTVVYQLLWLIHNLQVLVLSNVFAKLALGIRPSLVSQGAAARTVHMMLQAVSKYPRSKVQVHTKRRRLIGVVAHQLP